MSSTAFEDAHQVIEWIGQNNGFWNSDLLEIKTSKLGGIGVFAKKDIDPVLKPTVLLRLHKESILSFQKSSVANLITEEGIDGALALVITFIYEKHTGSSSPWFPFIKSVQYKNSKGYLILPPSLWSKREKVVLQGTELDIMGALDDEENKDAFERACTFALNQFELSNSSIEIPWELDIEEKDDDEVLLKYQTFVAISHAVASRDFEIDEYHQVGLVPGACLFNHSNKPTVRFESLFDVCFACGNSDPCDHIPDEDQDEEFDEDEGNISGEDENISDDQGGEESETDDIEQDDEEVEINDSDETDDSQAHSHSHSHSHNHDGCCDGDESESESEEEFDGPIEEFIEHIEEALQREQELEDEAENESEDEPDHSDDIVIEDDGNRVSPDACCDIVLTKKVAKGEELFNTYGDFSNPILLSKYGFVIPNNSNDRVGLGLQFLQLKKKNKKLYNRQFEWWDSQGYLLMKDYLHAKRNVETDHESCCDDGNCGDEVEGEEETDDVPDWTIEVSISHSGEPTPITFALLKLLSLNKLELLKFLKNPSKVNLKLLTVNDSKAFKLLKELVEQRARQYNKDIKLQSLLKSTNIREILAAQLVSDEQTIIKRSLDYLNKKV